MLRVLYSFLFYLSIPGIILRLIWRGRRLPAYRDRWKERFGFIPVLETAGGLWVHAVSLGEVKVASPLIKRFQAEYPKIPVVVTTMTPTGSEELKKTFGDSVSHVYLPYDLPSAVKRFLRRVKPGLSVIIETELWPNLLHYCRKDNIPVMLANARLSERSATGYRRIAAVTKRMLQAIALLAVQTETHANRFQTLGASNQQIKVTGNIKFDSKVDDSIIEEAKALRRQWGNRPVWIAASTHQGEEEQILSVFRHIQEAIPEVLLVLVPRHPDRFQYVEALCEKRELQVVKRTDEQLCSADTEVFLGNTVGELNVFYGASDVAFVGGSLVPVGGHNIIEPIALGVPAVVGPYTFNFEEITQQLVAAGSAVQVGDQNALVETVTALLREEQQLAHMAEKGQAVLAENQGSLDRHMALISTLLPEATP